MEYFEVKVPDGDGRCSDRSCPCPEPGTLLPRGTGYLYISEQAVNFRRDCRTRQQFRDKMKRLQSGRTFHVFASGELIAPLLVCEQGARKRNLDLEIAIADAKHWWETTKVPLRPTPLADSKEAEQEKERMRRAATQSNLASSSQKQQTEKKWWQFWK